MEPGGSLSCSKLAEPVGARVWICLKILGHRPGAIVHLPLWRISISALLYLPHSSDLPGAASQTRACCWAAGTGSLL